MLTRALQILCQLVRHSAILIFATRVRAKPPDPDPTPEQGGNSFNLQDNGWRRLEGANGVTGGPD